MDDSSQPQNPISQPENNSQPAPAAPQPENATPAAPAQPAMPAQPVAQPAAKAPMSKSNKKMIIVISSIVGAVAVVAIVLAIVLPNVLRVNYSTAYNTAKDLKPKIYDIYQSYDCEYVSRYVNQSYIDNKDYADYITKCLDVFDSGADNLVSELQNTEGITRNDDLKTQFEKFNAEYSKVSSGDQSSLEEKLDLYKVWHSYAVALDDLSYYKSTDAEITKVANILINSDNDTLKEYGKTWLEKTLAVATAYRDYDTAGLLGASDKYKVYQDKLKEQEDWVKANKPDMTELVSLDFSDTSKMYSEFTKLYDMIADTYSNNYNFGSKDCTEFMNEAYCE